MIADVGLRTTRGVVPASGDVFNPLPVVGPIARTAADTALLLAGLRGHDPQLPLARPVTDAADDTRVFTVLRAVMMAGAHGDLAATARDQLKDTLIWNIEQGLALTGPQIAAATGQRSEIFRRAKAFLRHYDPQHRD